MAQAWFRATPWRCAGTQRPPLRATRKRKPASTTWSQRAGGQRINPTRRTSGRNHWESGVDESPATCSRRRVARQGRGTQAARRVRSAAPLRSSTQQTRSLDLEVAGARLQGHQSPCVTSLRAPQPFAWRSGYLWDTSSNLKHRPVRMHNGRDGKGPQESCKESDKESCGSCKKRC